jgi:hypothetical protein
MSPRDEFAWRYFHLGWNPVVLCDPRHAHVTPAHLGYCGSPGKVPVGRWKELQSSRRPGPDLLAELLTHPAGNLGLVLGASTGLAAIDVDSPEGMEWAESALAEPGSPPRFTTGRGLRLLYRAPQGEVPSRVLRPGVELLSRGRCTVAPPSVHPGGHAYAWCREYDFASLELPPLPAGLEQPAEAAPTQAPRPLAEGEGAGEMRNETLFRLACALRRHGAGVREMLECLQVFNRRCRPPLADQDLTTIARSAGRYSTG